MIETAVTSVERRADLIIVHVVPENPDPSQLQQLEAKVSEAGTAHSELPLVLDLSQVNYIPSLSLGMLIGMATDFCGRGQKFMLAGIQPRVRQVFAVAQLDKFFNIHDSVEAAARSVSKIA